MVKMQDLVARLQVEIVVKMQELVSRLQGEIVVKMQELHPAPMSVIYTTPTLDN